MSAALKHFSGHGDTAGDSHVGLPEVNKSKEEVMNMELSPFMNVADEGVDIITDTLNMQAIANHFGQAEASLRSFNAGADILLMPVIMRSNEDVEKLEKVYAILENAVHEGEITEERLNDFVRRVLELKEKRGISNTTKYNQPVKEKVKKALSVVGSKEHL